jgi:lipopolysaccharide/colanic/teichoic acid biosynthesis glycosyltransferase
MYLIVKRVIDVCVAGTILIFSSPLWMVLMIILRSTGESEIFFKQNRIGYNNKEFLIWKFATMLKDSPSSGTITAENDARILPLGRFLRKTKINELPQLLNVVTGEMSIVGPRPLTRESFNLFPEELKPLVYQAKVGVTGIGSIVFRNEEQILANSGKELRQCYREDIMPVKGALEVWYQQNISLMTDVKIGILTVIAIIKPNSTLHGKWFKDLPVVCGNGDAVRAGL